MTFEGDAIVEATNLCFTFDGFLRAGERDTWVWHNGFDRKEEESDEEEAG